MSRRNQDNHNRIRSKTIAFRVSPEEDEQLNIAVSLTGLTKQDFIISKLLDRSINVQASCKVHRAVYDRLSELVEQLSRLSNATDIDDELMDNIILVSSIVDGLYSDKNKQSQVWINNLQATGNNSKIMIDTYFDTQNMINKKQYKKYGLDGLKIKWFWLKIIGWIIDISNLSKGLNSYKACIYGLCRDFLDGIGYNLGTKLFF